MVFIMVKYGYGGSEEALYLQAYDLAESGHPTLLFSFESATIKLVKILMSHKLKIEIDDLDLTDDALVDRFTQRTEALQAPFRYVDEVSLSLQEISDIISKNKASHKITHVVFDRVNPQDSNAINQLGLKLNVIIKY